jgi:hypothetical protein
MMINDENAIPPRGNPVTKILRSESFHSSALPAELAVES